MSPICSPVSTLTAVSLVSVMTEVMKVFPVDTHVLRITRRLGLLPQGIVSQKAHEQLTPLIPPDVRYPMHLLLITHGRAVCRARNPLCRRCVVLRLCPHPRRIPGGSDPSSRRNRIRLFRP